MQIVKTAVIVLIAAWLVLAFAIVRTSHNVILTGFLIFVAAERFWEVFFTAKQNILKKESQFDPLFIAITFAYAAMMYGTLGEYALSRRPLNNILSLTGLVIFLNALALRLWAIKSLGPGWNCYISSKIKTTKNKYTLIKTGPYRVMRHPMYLGTIMETLSIPLIFNAYFAFGFSLLVCLPLLVMRAFQEEKESAVKFNRYYRKYKKVTGFLFPRSPKRR
jgi:protein-S-isoprenylcysteine O-methyltransferase Ste14